MSDYISREAALEVFCRWCGICPKEKQKPLECDDILGNVLHSLPAADVRPVVRGKWEDVNVRDYSTNINGGLPLSIASMFCPICGRWHNEVYHYGNPTEMAHFCPNCGADMREEDDRG